MKTRGLLLSLAVLSLMTPANAITWQEVLDAISQHNYDFPIYATNKNVTCIKVVTWEEYVEGSGRHQGYVIRRGWDSNPRIVLAIKRFRIVRFRPLSHLSLEASLRQSSTSSYE